MRYQQPTFTEGTSNGRISTEEYEVRVGLRCPDCRMLKPHVCPMKQPIGTCQHGRPLHYKYPCEDCTKETK